MSPFDFQSIVVLTGAGVSAESGLKTFRDHGGLWENHSVTDVASPEGFARDPNLVHRFYNLRRAQLLAEAKPNRAHQALAEFEAAYPGELLLVTQNVDNLHEQAGSQKVLHMHGELLKKRCAACGLVSECREDLSVGLVCPSCEGRSTLRPHIVWFGEMPLGMHTIEQALARCDLFVAVGTSGSVYPAAGFVQIARHFGAATVELNLARSDNADCFDQQVLGPASQVVAEFFGCSPAG